MDEDVAAQTTPLAWPLVDRRRRGSDSAPGGRERRERPSGSTLDQLAEANQLLTALHEMAQTLPTSLDLDEVLNNVVERAAWLMGGDTATILLRDPSDGVYHRARGRGPTMPLDADQLAPHARAALADPSRAHLVDHLDGRGFRPDAVTGVYVASCVQHRIIGLLAVESTTPHVFEGRPIDVFGALAEPFAMAVDNARLFRQIRTVAADEERKRLARNVHDRIGSSVALLGFEVDRLLGEHRRGTDVGPGLVDLRGQITSVVGQVRHTLHDLRTDVSDEHRLAETLSGFLDRLGARSPLTTHLEVDDTGELPVNVERELWQMALEALLNVERHSGAANVWVTWRCDDDSAELVIRDDGKGLQPGAGRADSYGLTGMRERAAAVGGRIHLSGGPGSGTTVRITVGTSPA